MKIGDLCVRDVAACTKDSTLARAGALMRRHDVGCLPVVDRTDRVVGLVTDRQIALETSRRNALPSEIFVDEIMTEEPAACSTEDDLHDVLRTMGKKHCRRLPVVDAQGRLEGIVSIDDIVCHVAEDPEELELTADEVLEAFCNVAHPYVSEAHERNRRKGRR